MKVFVYDKRDSHTIEILDNVISVTEIKHPSYELIVVSRDRKIHTFDTRKVKTRIYQN